MGHVNLMGTIGKTEEQVAIDKHWEEHRKKINDHWYKDYHSLPPEHLHQQQAAPNQVYKADGGKADTVLLNRSLVHALAAVQATLDYGAQKYEPESWRKVEPVRYESATGRHLRDIYKGEIRDKESGLLHRAHAVICQLFILDQEIRESLSRNSNYDYTTFNKPPLDHKKTPGV